MSTIYEYFSGVKPCAGNEFKLLYGNREKMDSASGLAVWLFDSVTIKPENIQFTETIPNKTNPLIQLHSPHAGNEFKFIYGNKDKVDLAVDKSEFIFGNINERDTITGISCVEVTEGKCGYAETNGCTATGLYEIRHEGTDTRYTYKWRIVTGSAIITSDDTKQYVYVKTSNTQSNEQFTLACMVIYNMVAQREIIQSFTHTREDITITIDSLTEM